MKSAKVLTPTDAEVKAFNKHLDNLQIENLDITPKQCLEFKAALPDTKTGIFTRREVNAAFGKITRNSSNPIDNITYKHMQPLLQYHKQPKQKFYNLSHLYTNLDVTATKTCLESFGTDTTTTDRTLNAVTKPQSAPAIRTPNVGFPPEDVYIPAVDRTFVRWGAYRKVATIIKSESFFPVYVTGHSGNGKTIMVTQACAKERREFVRVQISPSTDEDDLIGGMRLSEVNGATVTEFVEGPVIRAMRAGAILLLDELDRGTNKIMCLQGVLEGLPIQLKKTGEVVKPAPGFNVIATTNTKGRGDANGRYIAASIIDDAFLERFPITIEQPFASMPMEKKILNNHFVKFGMDPSSEENTQIVAQLLLWADNIRKAYDIGGVPDVITTRRLCLIIETFRMFNSIKEAIELCIARFDDDTQESFNTFWEVTGRDIAKANKAGAQETT